MAHAAMSSTTGTDRVAAFVDALVGIGGIARPPASMDPLLDATERCVSRYGLRRASMTDLAREMNVARTTLYRQVGSVEEALVLAGARIANRFLDDVEAAMLGGKALSDACVDVIVRGGATRIENPLLRRFFEHEPEAVGEWISRGGIQLMVHRLSELALPMVKMAIDTQQLRQTDPELAADLLARTAIMTVMSPPEQCLRATVEFALSPLVPNAETADADRADRLSAHEDGNGD